jgi:alkylmercury lyase
MPQPAPSLEMLADSLAGTFPARDDAPLAHALLRELAKGRPVAPAADDARLAGALARWPNVERDEHGRVVACSGLSLTPTAHRFTVGGRQLFTWCAWDTLFVPALLGQPAHVESSCPVTGHTVLLTAEPSGFRDVQPDDVWVSFPPAATTSTTDITGTFCCHVHFLAGPSAADEWMNRHAGRARSRCQRPSSSGGSRLAAACRRPSAGGVASGSVPG